jgi:hypothetical protein
MRKDTLGILQENVRKNTVFQAVFRIHVIFGLPDPDPDPLVKGMDPDPDPSIIMQKY